MTVLQFPHSESRNGDDFERVSGVPPLPAAQSPPDFAQREQALDITRSWIVEAPAGSGKTGLLIQRFLRLLAVVNEPEAVLALTFTNKATAEMRARVLEALEAAATAGTDLPEQAFERETLLAAQSALAQDTRRAWKLLESPYRLNIRTIDSLCGEIARAVPVLTGGVGQASPLTDASAVYGEAARAVFLGLGGADPVLNNALRTVLLLRDGNLQDCEQLLANMLQTREQWGKLVPLSTSELNEQTLDDVVLPRLNKTLGSVLCGALGRLQRSFPSDILAELTEVASHLAVEPGYKDSPNPLLPCSSLRQAPGGEAIDLVHWKMLAHLLLKKDGGWRNSFNVNHVLLAIPKPMQAQLKSLIAALEGNDQARELLCSLDDLPPAAYPADQWVLAKALFRLLRYALIELKLIFADRNVCDFTELSIAARAAMQDVDGANRVTHALGVRLQHLLVDEMQDTSSSQYELLEDLTQGWEAPSQTVFLVGDPKQSIYLFRQARVERFIKGMQAGALGDVQLGLLRLTANFRSGKTLVGEFNDMFGPVFKDALDGVSYTEASSVRPPSTGEELRWHAEVLAATEDPLQKAAERKRAKREEAETVANLVCDWRARALREQRAPAKIAVLVRSKNHAITILKKLKEAGVPFRAVEMEQLNERPEVLDALSLTRALLHPADRVAWLAVLRAPWCGAGLADLHMLAAGDERQHAADTLRLPFRERAQKLDSDAKARVLRTLDVLDDAVNGRGRNTLAADVERTWHALGASLYTSAAAARNVRRYFELLQDEEQNAGYLTADRLASRLRKLFAEPDTAADAVDVMTVHKAKGLEWDMVLVPALERSGRRDALPLLDWLEIETNERDGSTATHVMLAPVPARGDEPGSLNRFVRKARCRQESAELKRLLYVAATRARTSLQMFATVATTKSGLERKPNTLLQVVWEQVQGKFEAAQQDAAARPAAEVLPMTAPAVLTTLAAGTGIPQEEAASRSPRLQRLPLSVVPAELLRATLPPLQRAGLAFSRATFARPQGSFRARALGNAVHAFLEYLAGWIAHHPESRHDVAMLSHEILSWQKRVKTLVRGAGLPLREVDRIATAVQQALQNTVDSFDGLWLMQPHQGARSEAELIASQGDAAVSKYRMDRSFYAGNAPGADGCNVLWIVDYKTADHPVGDTALFLQAERSKYKTQLELYADLQRNTLSPSTTVMLALYHPLLPNLQYWPYRH